MARLALAQARALIGQYQALVKSDGALAYWPLNEPVGSATVADQAGTLPGTVAGSVTLGVTGVTPAEPTNTAATFDGNTGIISTPATGGPGPTGTLSLEAWFRTSIGTGSSWGIVLSHGPYGTNGFAEMGKQSGGAYAYSTVITAAGQLNLNTPSTPINDGAWHHLVASWNLAAGSATLYVDGAVVSTITFSATTIAAYVQPFTIGNRSGQPGNGIGLLGSIQHAAVYPAALSAAQVLRHYASGRSIVRPALVVARPVIGQYQALVKADGAAAYWPLNDVPAAVLSDTFSRTSGMTATETGQAYTDQTGGAGTPVLDGSVLKKTDSNTLNYSFPWGLADGVFGCTVNFGAANGAADKRILFGYRRQDASNTYFLQLSRTSDSFNARWSLAGVTQADNASGSGLGLQDNTDYRIRVVCSGPNQAFYLATGTGPLVLKATWTNANFQTATGGQVILIDSSGATISVDNLIGQPLPASFADQAGTNIGTSSGCLLPGVTGTTPAEPTNLAAAFDGVTGCISGPHATPLVMPATFSLEAWVYKTADANWQRILDKGAWPNEDYFLIANNAGGVIGAFINASGNEYDTPTAPLPFNTWTHLVATYDGANLRLYVNGVAAGAPTAVASSPRNNATGWAIGSQGGVAVGNGIWHGRIQHAAIYPVTLSAAQVLRHYLSGKSLLRGAA